MPCDPEPTGETVRGREAEPMHIAGDPGAGANAVRKMVHRRVYRLAAATDAFVMIFRGVVKSRGIPQWDPLDSPRPGGGYQFFSDPGDTSTAVEDSSRGPMSRPTGVVEGLAPTTLDLLAQPIDLPVVAANKEPTVGLETLAPPVALHRVLIVDTDATTRRFLWTALNQCPQFAVTGEAGTHDVAVRMAEILQPDIVLLDLRMSLVDGFAGLNRLLQVAPDAEIVLTSGKDLLDAGATAFIPAGIAPWELLDRLDVLDQRIAASGPVVSVSEARQGRFPSLAVSTRQRAVVCDGEPPARHLITHVLESQNVIVTTETDAAPTLLAAVELARPELVVLDLWLNGSLGATILPEIRALSPRSRVIVYSEFEEWRDKAMSTGASAFVTKPDIEQLADRIGETSTGC